VISVSVQDGEALSLAVRGDRKMIAWLDFAARGEAEVVASQTTLGEAYDGRTPEAPSLVSRVPSPESRVP
jgi:hypothetical protein